MLLVTEATAPELAALTATALRVLIYLWAAAGHDNTVWPTQTTLGNRLKCTRKTINRALRELETHGWLATEDRGGRGLTYTLLTPPSARTQAPDNLIPFPARATE